MEFDLEQSIAVLERTPRVLSGLLDGLGEQWTHGAEGPDTWRPFDVIGHLIDAEETNWLARARVILADGGDRRFPPFDRYRHLSHNQAQALPDLLSRFAALRARSLTELRALRLGAADLARTGLHPEFGEVTLAQLLATWVVHDLAHLGQIARVMAKQYTEAVGPWQAYLSILRR